MRNLSKMLTAACVVAALGTLLAVPAMAQSTTTPTPGHQGMMLQHIAAKLNLTEDQQSSAKQLMADLKTKMQPVHESAKALRTQLQSALSAANPDAATVGNLVIQQHQNRAAMKAAWTEYQSKFEALLTPDQLTAYKAMLAKHASFRAHRMGGAGNGSTQTQ